MLVYNQWKVLIDETEALLMAANPAQFAATQFTPNGIPGIFVPYLPTTQTLARGFMNEFVNVRLNICPCRSSLLIGPQCTFIGIIIWASLDPTNYLIPPVLGPFLISFA